MKVLRPLLWHEGLFLQPQHLQIEALFHQERLAAAQRCLNPYPWGLLQLEIREGALANQLFEVERLEVVFPDGTWVKVPGNARVSGRPLQGAWAKDTLSVPVYVGLRNWADERPNVSATSPSGDMNGLLPVKGETRFVVQDIPEAFADVYAHQGEALVRFLDYDLRLFVGAEREEVRDYSLIQIAELKLDGQELKLSEDFIPPVLWSGASTRLWALIREVRDRITGRGQDLAGYKATRLGRSAQPGGQDVVLILTLQCLNRNIARWHHLTETERVHPYDVYALLRGLIGELSTFVADADALGAVGAQPPLPPYRHEAPGPCFLAGMNRLSALLDALTAGPDYVIDLLFDGTYFSADLKAVHFQGRKRFYLVLASEVGQAELNRLLTGTAKIGAREHLPLLIARALPGLLVDVLPEVPPALPRRTGSAYFELNTRDREPWRRIQEGQNLALYFDAPIRDLKAQLMVVHEGD